MIKVDNEIYRNIQEQVQANKEAIEAFEGVEFTLNNFGIKVLGKLDESPEGTDYEFGDAYLVGETAPYDMYIFTRNADPTVAGTWVNVGPLNIVGQKGEDSTVPGPAGKDGYAPVVRYGNGLPVVEATDKSGYIYIDQLTARLYTFSNNQWNYVVNMKGPAGQSIQGPQGAQGTTLSIVGKLASPSLLPTNFTSGAIPKNSSYLVDVQGANHLYIILGDINDYSTWYWQDAGQFNVGTILYKDSEYQVYSNITDSYSTTTGALATDIATSTLYNDIQEDLTNYVETEDLEDALNSKADKTQLSGYVDKTSAEDVSGQKSFTSTVICKNPDYSQGDKPETSSDRFFIIRGKDGKNVGYVGARIGGGATEATNAFNTLLLGCLNKYDKTGLIHFQCGGTSAGVTGGVLPGTNDTFNIGSSSYAWKNLYLTGDIYKSGSKVALGGGMDLLYDGNSTNHVVGTKYDTSKSLTDLSKYHMLAFDIRCGGNESYRSELHFCKVPTATTTNVSSYAYSGTLSTAFTLSIVSSVALTQQMLVYYGVETSTNTLKFVINRLNQLTKSSSADSFTTKTDGNSGDYIRIYGIY